LLLRKAGRQRGIEAEAARLLLIFSQPQMRQLSLVEEAMGRQALALLGQLSAASQSAHDLGEAAAKAFRTHPDAVIMTSFPGISDIAGARVLGELGDDRSWFADARAVKAYAGAAPVTRASGKSRAVNHRRIKNQRLASTGYLWAFSTLTASMTPDSDHQTPPTWPADCGRGGSQRCPYWCGERTFEQSYSPSPARISGSSEFSG
jgi:transposase